MSDGTEVTAAAIARLAGVGRAAVSNWRRRYADFPRPVGGTETSPSFALDEVENWLSAQGKLAELPLRERVWRHIEGAPEGAAPALLAAGETLLGGGTSATGAGPRDRGEGALGTGGGPRDTGEGSLGTGGGPRDTGEADGAAGHGGHGPAGGAVSGAADASADATGDLSGDASAASTSASPPASTGDASASAPAPATGTASGATSRSAANASRAARASGTARPDARDAELAQLAREMGPDEAYGFLLGRYFDANPRQYTLTPPETAALMAGLAGPADSFLDPACGSGELLAAALDSAAEPDSTARLDFAARRETPAAEPDSAAERDSAARREREAPAVLHGQESDPVLARLTALRLTLRVAARARAASSGALSTAVHIRSEDALRTEPGSEAPSVDAVLCHPPFNERNWGHEELAYDPRWAYGLPARTESELAWVQHALARLRPGGTAVMLLPPAVASRRTGRRVRAALLRKGVLRAVVALPPGAAAPHSLPLHLWVLRKPDGSAPSEPRLLVMDTGDKWQAGAREPLPWRELGQAVLAAWRAYDAGGDVPAEPGVCGTLAAIDLLDDEVDLTPARHLLPGGGRGDAAALATVRAELEGTLRRTLDLARATAAEEQGTGEAGQAGGGGSGSGEGGGEARSGAETHWPEATVGELARGGALEVHTAGAETVTTAPGDVVIPVQGRGAAYVVAPDEGGEALGKPLSLLRPDPAALDPWFIAGFLRSTANTRQASSYASSASRIDVRRLRLPRLPLERQRRYGETFRRLATFESGLRRVGELGEEFVQGMFDGLADGTLPPG
ncbi:HsdM family class I SAM-dependent methyltransferase [Streptomyces iconiensis]|uniref:N-6 DNA methylase n=1 Tax=Streptomyces iconiensis TaxID=1384038 RepID=A0ABT7A7C2_9ACTN|nr:N-6 DNA methylase [Streptomyces iconiensis]MDJ1136528.1 N-6 DNA methylase [Streptomyces iconiensis]